MKSGTDEQEQKGVTAPRGDGQPARLPVGPIAHEFAHSLGREHRSQQPHDVDHGHQHDEDLRHVHDEEVDRGTDP